MTIVAVLARAPIPGRVKTRLAAAVGPHRAVAVYRALGERVVSAVAAEHRVCVWYDPPGSRGVMRDWLGTDVELRPQVEGDLGERLSAAFESHFASGDGPVIAIGTDTPGLDAAVVSDARQSLERADVVLGPATDGGYYLVGLNQPHAELFRDVPWSTPRVLGITLDVCKTLHIRTTLLEPLRDVDTATDLTALGLDQYP